MKVDDNNDNDLIDFETIKFARPSEIYRFVSNQGGNNIESDILSLQNVNTRRRLKRFTQGQISKTSNIYYLNTNERDNYLKINEQENYVYSLKAKSKSTTNQINTPKSHIHMIIVLAILSAEVSNVDTNKSLILKEAQASPH